MCEHRLHMAHVKLQRATSIHLAGKSAADQSHATSISAVTLCLLAHKLQICGLGLNVDWMAVVVWAQVQFMKCQQT